VLPLLTKYLIQYKRVCIPHIGTFEIVQHSPQLDIADKLFIPPRFTTKHLKQDAVPEHQFNFFASSEDAEKEKLKDDLSSFGQNLKHKIEKGPFRWTGFGTLSYAANEVVFEPQAIELDSLQNIPAEKVIRLNVAHHVLVGDREFTSHQMMEQALRDSGHKRPLYMIIGWIILILAILAIIFILYTGNFQTGSAGSGYGL
jgi:hypothetical protein